MSSATTPSRFAGLDAPREAVAHVVDTVGVTSSVEEDMDRVGHVLFGDFDDARLDEVESVASNLDGVSVILESSPSSFHLWNLSVRSFRSTVSAKRLIGDDVSHLEVGGRRRRFVLRVGAKRFVEDGEIYKDAPAVRGVVCRPTRRPQSRGHLSLARNKASREACARVSRRLQTAEEMYDLVGDGVTTETYATMTDKAKGWCE